MPVERPPPAGAAQARIPVGRGASDEAAFALQRSPSSPSAGPRFRRPPVADEVARSALPRSLEGEDPARVDEVEPIGDQNRLADGPDGLLDDPGVLRGPRLEVEHVD